MKARATGRSLTSLLALALLATSFLAAASAASASPVLKLNGRSTTAVGPEDTFRYAIAVGNYGDEETKGTATLLAHLPAGVHALGVSSFYEWSCTGDGPGAAPKIVGANELACTIGDDAEAGNVYKPLASPHRQLLIEAKAEGLAEGEHPVARYELYFAPEAAPSPARTDGSPCDTEPPGTPCATTVDPLRIDSTPQFGIDAFDFTIDKTDGTPDMQAGAHPFSQTTYLDFETTYNPNIVPTAEYPDRGEAWPTGMVRDVVVELPPGFVGDVTKMPTCSVEQLLGEFSHSFCPAASQVGATDVRFDGPGAGLNGIFGSRSVHNMVPPPGFAARFGFEIIQTMVAIDFKLGPGPDYNLIAMVRNASQGIAFTGSELTVWGDPSDEGHRRQRHCPGTGIVALGAPTCPGAEEPVAFLRNPTSCTGEGLAVAAHIDSWEDSGAQRPDGLPELFDPRWSSAAMATHETPGFPRLPSEWGEERGIEGCDVVPVHGTLEATPTTRDTETPSGLTVHVEVPNPGLENAAGIASSDIKKVKVELPAGMSVNPSQAEGLGVCTPVQYANSALSFLPENPTGCPNDSKIGTVEVKTPLLEETIPGEVFVAKPLDNPFGSLLALYMVLEEPQRGVLIKSAGRVETDPATGQITTTFDNLPQTPFSSFDFKFREGARAPLVTPQACGTYTTRATFTPWSDPGRMLVSISTFTIDRGIGASPCPTGGIPPFKPGLIAGTRNNAAGSFSPFDVRLFRSDAEQQFTNFSIKLPPGVSGKLAGVPFCPDAAIEAARHRSGAEELTSPSCPAPSYVGRSLVGAGVGSVQTYVGGKVYLAGPYNGSALSIAAITAAKVGPFDLGTVVVRYALKVDPATAEVFVDATGSDPLPHIIEGIPTKLRDIRAYVDRPEFVLNPTSCAPTSTASTVLGSGLDFASPHDDEPVTVSTRFQAADCAALGYRPRLSLRLLGKTKRGGNPKLRAVFRPRAGNANTAKAQVTLPRSAFLDQEHIGTVCTRVQYVADACPKRSIYGRAVAFTPILDEALRGPVYLRSSEHKLPDLVASLKSGRIEIDLVGRIDSLKGRIRSTFEAVPDAPVSRFVLTMAGGKRSLIENSANLCKGTHRAIVALDAHNGKIRDFRPKVRAQCAKRRKAKRSAHRARAR